MKRLTVLFTMLLCAGYAGADSRADRIVGVWLNEAGDGLIRIEREGDLFVGRIAGAPEGTRDQELTDVNNPEPSLRDRPLLGLQIMGDYRFDGRRWTDGWIYDPDKGERYSSRLTLDGDDRLRVRGFIGVSMLGRTEVWSRVEAN